jgi:hypothetical protein
MKKTFTTYLFLLFSTVIFSQNAKARKSIAWGFRAGFNYSIPKKYANNSQDDGALSELVGVYLQTKFQDIPFSLQNELLYKTTRVGIYSGDVLKTQSIELPFSICYLPNAIKNKNLGFFVGLAPSIPFFSETNLGKITKFTPAVNLSYFVGTKILLPSVNNRLGFDIRFSGYLWNNYAYKRCYLGRVGCPDNMEKTATVDVAFIYNFR